MRLPTVAPRSLFSSPGEGLSTNTRELGADPSLHTQGERLILLETHRRSGEWRRDA